MDRRLVSGEQWCLKPALAPDDHTRVHSAHWVVWKTLLTAAIPLTLPIVKWQAVG